MPRDLCDLTSPRVRWPASSPHRRTPLPIPLTRASKNDVSPEFEALPVVHFQDSCPRLGNSQASGWPSPDFVCPCARVPKAPISLSSDGELFLLAAHCYFEPTIVLAVDCAVSVLSIQRYRVKQRTRGLPRGAQRSFPRLISFLHRGVFPGLFQEHARWNGILFARFSLSSQDGRVQPREAVAGPSSNPGV